MRQRGNLLLLVLLFCCCCCGQCFGADAAVVFRQVLDVVALARFVPVGFVALMVFGAISLRKARVCGVSAFCDAEQGVSSVDLQRYEFLCNGCSAGKASAKKIGTDRFTAFEVQKLLNKFG